MRKVVLIFPPATDPRSPHLSLPSLTAALRFEGVNVRQIDADLEGLFFVLKKDNLLRAINYCKKILGKIINPEFKSAIIGLLNFSDYIIENIDPSISRLRDPDLFYNPFIFLQAKECLNRALGLISAANYPVKYNIGPICYDVGGFNASNIEDLLTVTAHSKYNIFHSYYINNILPDLNNDRPDIVGISIVNYQQVIPGLALARLLKRHGHFVVIGGTLYSKFVPHLLKQPRFFKTFCDGVIPYEGETALLELLEHIPADMDYSKVPNFIHLNSANIPTLARTHIEDVNKLQTPDFEGLPLGQYLAPDVVLPILTGKGCYFNLCKFCDIPFINSISRKSYRVRSCDQVANDIHTLNKRHGARFFQITDESMSPTLLTNLGNALERYPDINARFVGYARLEAGFTAEVCDRIYRMGIRKLFFGLESGSQRTLDHMKKGININNVPKVLKNCSVAGISFHLFSIVGFPEETESEANKTLNFFLENKEVLNPPCNSFDIHPYMLDLRTEYSNNAEAYGIEIKENPDNDFPLSIDKWKNLRGIQEEEVSVMISHFHQTLREFFPEYRQFPVHLWPSFEEYSILYADKYDKKTFLYRFNLPPAESLISFSFIWTDSVKFLKSDQNYSYEIACLTGSVTVSAVTVKLLIHKNETDTVSGHFESFLSELQISADLKGEAELFLRKEIDGILSIGAIYLQPTEIDYSAYEQR